MTKHTTRDRIWSAALKTAEEYEGKTGFWGSEFSASDVLEELDNGASARSVRDTLATMADLGHIQRGRAQGKYKPNESSSTKDPKESSGPSIEESSAATTWSSAEFDDDQEDVQEATGVDVDDLDLPGGGSTLEARREAVRACYEFLREEGTATKNEFIENIYSEHPARYQSSGGWWNAIGKEGLREIARTRDDVEAPAEGGHIWEYTG